VKGVKINVLAICLVALVVLAVVPMGATAKPAPRADTLLTITAPGTAEAGQSFAIEGALTSGGDGVVGTVNVYRVSGKGRQRVMTLVGSASTDTTGAFSVTVSEPATGTFSYLARFPGDKTYEDAQSRTVTVTVEVPANHPPTAAFSWRQGTLSVPVIYFDASASSDTDGPIASYTWDFGDEVTSTTTDRFPSHNYEVPGTYYVTLTVTDDDGATDSVSHEVTAVGDPPLNDPPTADFSWEQRWEDLPAGFLTIQFDALNSHDWDGSIVSYAWDFGDGEKATGTNLFNPLHYYASAGTYTVTLTVTDDDGAWNTVERFVEVQVTDDW
jgi:PKD repeat protein